MGNDRDNDDDDNVEVTVALPYHEHMDINKVNPWFNPAMKEEDHREGIELPPLVSAIIQYQDSGKRSSSPPRTPREFPPAEVLTPTTKRVPGSTSTVSPGPRRAFIETGLHVGMRVLARRLDCGETRFEGVILRVDEEEGKFVVDFGYDDVEAIPGGFGNVIRHFRDEGRAFRTGHF